MSEKLLKERLPYRLREQFLSTTELSLLFVLKEMADDRYVICPKVSLNDIFYIQRPNENVHFYNKIFRKHVDFLLCEPDTMQPAFGVDLVRPYAKGKDETRSVDQFMDDLFLSAGLPLIHVPSSENYELNNLVQLFKSAVQKVKKTESLRYDNFSDSSPLCPECGLMMVLRIHRGGMQAGQRYYGCMNTPICNGVIPID